MAKDITNIHSDTSEGEMPVIILIGETGVGKSTFISQVLGAAEVKPEVGHGLASCTQDVKGYIACHNKNPRRRVRLVDTPGFNDSDCNEGDEVQVRSIIEFLRNRPKSKLAGILFLYDIQQPRATTSTATMKPSTISNPPGVCVVTTKWSANQKSREELERREEAIRKLFAIHPSAMKRFSNNEQSAWNIINDVMNSSSNITFEEVAKLLESILPGIKHRGKVSLSQKIRKWIARLF